MGIYVKDMEMPESCQKCPFLDYEEGFCFASGVRGNSGWYEFTFCPGEIKGGRHDDCPLVPVPPHGRLIDANILETHECYEGEWQEVVYKDDIDNAPTVIPADNQGGDT